jgi:beta-N-acetylhexosaminidase
MSSRAAKRRRRIALAACGGLAAGAFAFAVSLGDGTPERRSVAGQLTPAQLAGQRIVAGFPGARVPRPVNRMVREGRLAGVILFAGNLAGRAASRRLIRELQRTPRPAGLRDPLLVMVDQEGGLVKRVGGAPTASAREMGARGAAFSREQGRRAARNLGGLGVNVNLAPVLDVARPGGTIAETERGFGASPERVAETAVPFAEAMREGGVAATAKHFPGMGAASENTDFAVERVGLSKQELRRADEPPFRRFVAAGGELVMLSTAIYPAFSPRPAAFARPIATGELRRRLGFEGVSITDALETVAVRAFGGPARAGLAAADAGVDLLLFADYRAGAQAQRALTRRIQAQASARAASEAAVSRILRLRHSTGVAASDSQR